MKCKCKPFLTSSTLDFETTSGIHQWGQGSIPVSPCISHHIRALVIRYRWGKGPILASETCAESLWGTMMYFQQMWAITCWLRSEWATLTQHMKWPCLHPKKCSAPFHSRGRFPSRTSWRCLDRCQEHHRSLSLLPRYNNLKYSHVSGERPTDNHISLPSTSNGLWE